MATAQEAVGPPPGSGSFGNPPVDVTALWEPTPSYVVTGLQQETRLRSTDGKVVPTILVTFYVPGYPGSFTTRLDNYGFTYDDPLAGMRRRSARIRAIYALPGALVEEEPPPPEPPPGEQV